MCLVRICYARNSCQINGDTEYLNLIVPPVNKLKLIKDIGGVLSTPCADYNLSDIDDIIMSDKKIGKELDICPPFDLYNFKNDE